ncbi:MAG TPA: hypothetical protein VNY36_03460 [Bacteroidia bacterium]|jgi:hypothetical protein|nr:hypothetical protein [Bacteroidia bacterium]
MSIKSIQIGQAGVSNRTPSWVYIETNDTIAAVTTAGYLNGVSSEYINALQDNMMALVSTKTSPGIGVRPVLYILQLKVSAGVWSLAAPAVDVPVPFIVQGNIQAGSSGTQGFFISYPATANKGSFVFEAVANTGNTVTTFSNDAMGQATIISIPDPANAAGQVLVGATTTPFVTGNFPVNSGTAGLMVDSGFLATNIMRKDAANVMASTGQITLSKVNGTEAANAVTASGNAGVITTSSLTVTAGSTYAITWTNTKITATSVIGLTVQGGTNTNQNINFSVVPGTGTATLTIYNSAPVASISGTIFIGYSVL